MIILRKFILLFLWCLHLGYNRIAKSWSRPYRILRQWLGSVLTTKATDASRFHDALETNFVSGKIYWWFWWCPWDRKCFSFVSALGFGGETGLEWWRLISYALNSKSCMSARSQRIWLKMWLHIGTKRWFAYHKLLISLNWFPFHAEKALKEFEWLIGMIVWHWAQIILKVLAKNQKQSVFLSDIATHFQCLHYCKSWFSLSTQPHLYLWHLKMSFHLPTWFAFKHYSPKTKLDLIILCLSMNVK